MRHAPPVGNARAGYVLVELVATLALTGLLLGFAFPFAVTGTTPSRLRALASSTASLLRDARTAAITGGRPVAVRFDPGVRRLSAGARRVLIPGDVDFTLVAGGNCPAEGAATAIVFRADGSDCGGVLRFAKGGRVLRTRVNWSDGFVDVLQGG